MGCFDINGCISKLPILYGDKCFLMFGVSRKEECYSTSCSFGTGYFFTPIALPIFGNYDDYGKIDNVRRDKNVEIIENMFNREIDEIISIVDDLMVGRYSMGDSEISEFSDFALNSLGIDTENYSLAFTIDHELVYESIRNLKINTYYDLEVSLMLSKKLPCTLKDYINDFDLQKKYGLLGNSPSIFDIPCIFDKMKNDYLSSIKSKDNNNLFWIKNGLVNLNPNYTEGIYNYNEYYDSYAFMRLYRGDIAKILLNDLGNEYVNFLSFFLKMKQMDWNIVIHNYSGQEGHSNVVALKDYYQNIVDFINDKINQER